MKRVICLVSLSLWSVAASAQDVEQAPPAESTSEHADASTVAGPNEPRLALSSHKTVSRRSSEGTGLWQYWIRAASPDVEAEVGSALVFSTPWDDTPRSPAQAAQDVANRYRSGSVEWKYWMSVAAQYDASTSGTVGDAQASGLSGEPETVAKPTQRPSI